MSKIEDTLWEDYKDVSDQLEDVDVDSSGHKVLLEERDKIRNELIEVERINQEVLSKESQIKSEDTRDKIRTWITFGTFLISIGASLYGMHRTFKFDEVATTTSTLGRGILNGFIPKIGKR